MLMDMHMQNNMFSKYKISNRPHCGFPLFRYLSNNKINVLELGALDHLGETLQVLRLSRNRISQIPVKAFQLPRLTQL